MTKQLRRLISQVSQQGQSVCDQLEKGQADTPLAEHFREIEADIDSAPFSVVLLGLTPEARAASLAWLYGNDFSVLTVNVVKQLGLVEISLRERGYALERANGERVEFDRLDPFMEALQQSDILSPLDGEEWVDPVRLAVNTPKGLHKTIVAILALVLSPSYLPRAHQRAGQTSRDAASRPLLCAVECRGSTGCSDVLCTLSVVTGAWRTLSPIANAEQILFYLQNQRASLSHAFLGASLIAIRTDHN